MMKLHIPPCARALVVAVALLPGPSLAEQGPARPAEPPREAVEVPPLTVGGRTATVPRGGDLQAALNNAQPGDTIVLEAGATYPGPYILPPKPGAGWITVRTNRLEQGFPPAGTRVGPQHAALMPRIVTRSGSAFVAARGAHHYRFVGLEISPARGVYVHNLVLLGRDENTPDQIPHHFIFERAYLHGDPNLGTRRGIALNGTHIAVIDSHLSDFKDAGFDSQALCGWNGPGPFRIENNYIEGAGENLMFGGAPPALRNVVPSDIEIRGNHFAKPLAWKGTRWTVKNLLELKNGRRVLIDGNFFENSWVHAQAGFAIVLTPRGEAPWAAVEDVTFTNNVVHHAEHGVNILGHDDGPQPGNRRASRLLFRNNLFDNISGRLFQLLAGPSDVVVESNTANLRGAVSFSEGAPASRIVFRGNLVAFGQYGIIGNSVGTGGATIAQYLPGAVVTNNVFFGDRGETEANAYPPGNVFTTLAGVGFVSPDTGDWRLRPDSRLAKRPGGKEVGVDFAQLLAALKANAPLALPVKGR
jgi:hypothetical protein